MPLLDVYDTPARWRDAPEGSGFYKAWHQKVCDLVSGAGPDLFPEARSRRIAGAQRRARASAEPNGSSPWFDPLTSEADVVAVRQLSWIGFPRESLVQHRDDRAAAFAEAEARMKQQHEYFEWHTYRDDGGRVTKVVFVTESPEYWEVLAATEYDVVVSLYQELVSPAVRYEDLFTNGAYQPLNRWNTKDGIVHCVNPEPGNRLLQAIGLAQGGVWMLETPDNYETVVARASHAVDDYLPLDVGAVMRSD